MTFMTSIMTLISVTQLKVTIETTLKILQMFVRKKWRNCTNCKPWGGKWLAYVCQVTNVLTFSDSAQKILVRPLGSSDMVKYRAVSFKKDQIAALYFTMSDIVHSSIFQNLLTKECKYMGLKSLIFNELL